MRDVPVPKVVIPLGNASLMRFPEVLTGRWCGRDIGHYVTATGEFCPECGTRVSEGKWRYDWDSKESRDA